MKKKILLSILLFSAIMLQAQKTYYVSSSTGNDLNNSTQAQSQSTPWASTAKVTAFFSSLLPGDRVLFKRGDTFPGFLICSQSGTATSPITIDAYGSGAKPNISGLTTVPSWVNLGSNIWESTSAVSTLSTCNMVVINGLNTPMGRTPNSGWYTIDSHNGNTQITSSSIGSPNWTGGEVVIRKNHFVIDRGTITNQSGSTITYSSSGTDDAQDGYGFFIQNDVRTLDAQNEWYYNPSTKKIRVYSTTSPTNVQVATVNRVVEVVQHNYITFSNISFNGSNNETFYLGSAAGVQIISCDLNYAGRNAIFGGNNFGSASSNFRLENSTIANTNNNALTMANEFVNPIIRSNVVTNTALIVGAGVSGTQGSRGIYSFGVDGMLVELNRYDSTGYIPIEFSGTNSIVQKNYVTNFCLNKDDGAGIYAYQDADPGKKILDNIVLNGTGNGSGTADGLSAASAIYMDDDCANVEIARNTGANCALMGMFLHNANNINVHDNTFYNNEIVFGTLGAQVALISDGSAGAITGISMNNNKMISKTAAQYTATFSDVNTGIPGFFTTLNNNYYARPISDVTTIHTLQNSYGTENYLTLAQWQSFSGKDLNSKKSPKTITTTNDLSFVYNETAASKAFPLSGSYIDVTGASYAGSITLQPYTSAVLIYNGSFVGLTASATSGTISCFGGSTTVTVNAQGGTPPYTGIGTFTRSAGTYTFTVTDAASNTTTTTITVSQPTAITVSETHTVIAVNGGTSIVTAASSGGTGSKSYSINGGAYQTSTSFTLLAGTYTLAARDASSCTNTITFTIAQPTTLVASSSFAAISCPGALTTVTVSASGGTPPYSGIGTFSVVAGTYSYTVTDAAGNTATTTITVTQDTIITISLAFGTAPATVTVTASGNISPYTYSLDGGTFQSSNVFTGVAAGNHTVTVRGNTGCLWSKNLTVISAGTPLTVSLSAGTITCNGGTTTATLTPAGGTAPYTYLWSNGQTTQTATALTAANYTGRATDNVGAWHDTTFTITQPAAVAVAISYAAIATNGGSTAVTFTGSAGVSPYTYSLDGGSYLSNPFAGVLAGNHTVIAKDANSCTSTKNFTITQPGAGLPYISVSKTAIVCNGGNSTVTITGSGGTAPLTVVGGSPQTKTSGTYTFSVIDALGARHDTVVTISQPTKVVVNQVVAPNILVKFGTTYAKIYAAGGTGSLTYSLDGGSYQASDSFPGISSGNHTILAKDASACVSSAYTFTVLSTVNNGKKKHTVLIQGGVYYHFSKDYLALNRNRKNKNI